MDKNHILSLSAEARAWAKTLTPIILAWLHGLSMPQPRIFRKKSE